MKRLGVLVVLCGAMTVPGCQSSPGAKFRIEGRTVTVKSEPAGARVTQIAQPSGARVDLGVTPLVSAPVTVLTQYKGSFRHPGSAQAMMGNMNVARLHIEKPGN